MKLIKKLSHYYFLLFLFVPFKIDAQCINKELSTLLINYIEFEKLEEYRARCLSNDGVNCDNIYELPTKCKISNIQENCKLIYFKNISINCISIEFRKVEFNNGIIAASTAPNESKFIASSDSVAFEFKAINSLEEYNMILKYCETNQEAVTLIDSIYHVFDIQTISKIEINRNQDMISITKHSHSTPNYILYFRKGKVYKITKSGK